MLSKLFFLAKITPAYITSVVKIMSSALRRYLVLFYTYIPHSTSPSHNERQAEDSNHHPAACTYKMSAIILAASFLL